jgi:2-dehydro-3-deoxyphosphogluconate aldolase/(4S)-4-hydroxy-2-oxoglutarate aldolase
MLNKAEILTRITRSGVVAVARFEDPEPLFEAARALLAGGVDVFEVTMTVPDALDVLRGISRRLAPDVVVGAGTVLDGETARSAILAGAQFVVAPTLQPDVIAVARRYGCVAVPGALSPTEILAAWEHGADVVKVFPAGVGGPAYIRDVLAPLPQIPLMPTGGVTLENAADFISAGAVVVGLGSALVDSRLLAAGRFEVLTERAEHLIRAVRAARAS